MPTTTSSSQSIAACVEKNSEPKRQAKGLTNNVKNKVSPHRPQKNMLNQKKQGVVVLDQNK